MMTWLISVAYVLGFLALTARTAQRAGRSPWLFNREQAVTAWGFRIAFACLIFWPLTRTGSGVIWMLLAALGAGFALYAQNHMGKSWRIGTADGQLGDLVSDGPFRFSRNPVFLGQMVLACALVPVGGIIALIGAAAMTLSAVKQVAAEEQVLSKDPNWQRYAKDVARWITLPGR